MLLLEIEQAKANLDDKLKSKTGIINDKAILLAVLGGIIGIFGTLVNTWIQHSNEIELENKKLNSTLIYKAIETNDRAKSIENLKFLLSLRLITDEDSALSSILNNKNLLVAIPAMSLIYNENILFCPKSATLDRFLPVAAFTFFKVLAGRTECNNSKTNPDFLNIQIALHHSPPLTEFVKIHA